MPCNPEVMGSNARIYSVGLFSDLGPLDRTIEKVSNPSLAIINECMLYS